jgi:hypothetical protein
MGNKNTTSESSIEQYFVRKCKENGMKVIKMIPTFEAGIPDRQVLYAGVSGFAEIKAPGRKPRALQVAYLNGLEQAGFFVGVIDSKEAANLWIEKFHKHATDATKFTIYCPICGNKKV